MLARWAVFWGPFIQTYVSLWLEMPGAIWVTELRVVDWRWALGRLLSCDLLVLMVSAELW